MIFLESGSTPNKSNGRSTPILVGVAFLGYLGGDSNRESRERGRGKGWWVGKLMSRGNQNSDFTDVSKKERVWVNHHSFKKGGSNRCLSGEGWGWVKSKFGFPFHGCFETN